MNDFRPDLSLGKYRFEHEIFDSALEQSFEDTSLYHNPETPQKTDNEVQHTKPGAIVGPEVTVTALSSAIAP